MIRETPEGTDRRLYVAAVEIKALAAAREVERIIAAKHPGGDVGRRAALQVFLMLYYLDGAR